MRLLVVKTSSLGDIVHTLPALGDAQRACAGLRCDWLVERAFAEMPPWHAAVERVVECDLRGWRRHPLRTVFGGEWSAFRTALRASDYDLVLDAQGLAKSAWLARQAHGPLAGPDRASAREPLAARFYDRGIAVPRFDAAHAVDRIRRLFAGALGYPAPLATPPEYGLDRARFPAPETTPYAVLLHGTTWPGKRWPRSHWQALARALTARGLQPVLAWGNADERAEAEAIAAVADGRVLPRQSITALAGWLAHARLVVGVDTGLMHLAAAFGTPGVSLYGATLPELTGAVGANQVWLRSDASATTIDRARANTVPVEQVLAALPV